jgi:hypothetical protein
MKMDSIMVKLINLATGELIDKDFFKLREEGIPKNFVVAEELSVEQWTEALQKAVNKGRINYSSRIVKMPKIEEK